jgi:solute carrier family 15 (peptide/histidine transporter), member 3/4
VLFLVALVMNVVAAFLADHGSTGKNISKASGAFIVAACVLWVAFARDSGFMDAAKQRLGGHFDEEIVDGVKQVIRILPFNAFNVVWWVCQNQRANNQTIVQQTDMRLGSGPFARQIPGPTMQMFNPVSVLFLVPLFDRVVYPLYERVAGKPASRYGKILTGYWLAVLAMVWTGCFEILRKSRPVLTYVDAHGVTKNILNNDGHQVMNAIAWYAAIPQYFLVALASIHIVIPSYDIGYSEVPQSMRSTTVALGFFVNSMGSTLQSVVVLLLGKFIPANLNKGHMEYLHFTLAGIMLVNIFFFWIVMRQMQLGMVPKLAKATRTKQIEITV